MLPGLAADHGDEKTVMIDATYLKAHPTASSLRAMSSSLPTVGWLLSDRGYDAEWFRDALENKGVKACIPGRKQRKTPVKYDKRRYKRRNRIETMFGRLKGWRSVATRYDRSPTVFLSAIALAALIIFWLGMTTCPDPRISMHAPDAERVSQQCRLAKL